MKTRFFLSLVAFVLTILSFTNCSKTENITADIEINDFVWRGMNVYYKWQSDVPDLSDTRFSKQSELNDYLKGFSSPDNLFYNILYYPNEYPKDPNTTYSWIVDDYIALENSFQAIRLTSGMKLRGAYYANGSGEFYIYVYDVVIGSDADSKGITRGMYITEIDGIKLTPSNVNELLSITNYTISLADFNNGNPITNGTTVTINQSEVQENPIKIATTLNEGGKTIGYLMYNQFSSAFDDELNMAFATFKSDGITDLIIDLRYNGGGSVRTASYLGTMISGLSQDNVFSKQVWNEKVMTNTNNELFTTFFPSVIDHDNINEVINSVDLTTVYFIVSDRTASASELIINALTPYIDVKLVGTQTYGKHVGSITLYDSDNYLKGGPNFNENHAWALQPIVLEIQNKNNENEPDGFIPEVTIEETPDSLEPFGDPEEALLKRTIAYIINGNRGTFQKSKTSSTHILSDWNSNRVYKDYNTMYYDLQ